MTRKFDFKTLGQPFEADWPVTVAVPQDGGRTEEQTFDVRFRTLTEEETAKVEASTDPAIERLRIGLVDVKGETFTPELREQLLGRHWVLIGLLKAWTSFAVGQPAKN